MKQFTFIFICFVFLILPVVSQDRAVAFEMNSRLGRGINIGNTFEAPTETEWGNPWDPDYFRIISELGFTHIRLPVRWDTPERSMESPPYSIEPLFLERIREVIDTALNYQMHIIINMHHHELIFDDPDENKERLLAQWEQIADFFKDYPDSLLFEVLNEPNTNLTPEKWNSLFAEALDIIRETNPERVVLMGTAEWGGLGAVPHIDLPDDPYLILSVHYYNPFNFTHQGASWAEGSDAWLGIEWLDTETDRQTIENEFKYTLQFREDNDIPVHVGEFGAYSAADIDSRVRWTTFLARWFEEQGLSWAYWEFSAGFGIYNPGNQELITDLVDALLHNPMPGPVYLEYDTLYSSNFYEGTDGWNLNTSGGASGQLLTGSGKLNVSISNPGTEAWNIQLVKPGISLTEGNTYRVTLYASSTGLKNITSYIGRASNPWNAYSDYYGMSISTSEDKYVYGFTMNENTDPAARIVFDLGGSTQGFNLAQLVVEKLKADDVDTDIFIHPIENITVKYYPNPVDHTLFIQNNAGFQNLTLLDLTGRVIYSKIISSSEVTVHTANLVPGMYFVILSDNEKSYGFRILKR